MDFKLQRRFHQRGYTTRHSEQNIQRCLDYAPLFSNAVPVIYNTSHLSVLVATKRVSKESRSSYQIFYRDFEVVKRNGKKDPYLNHCPV
jgi:RNA-directed DNA polymerase